MMFSDELSEFAGRIPMAHTVDLVRAMRILDTLATSGDDPERTALYLERLSLVDRELSIRRRNAEWAQCQSGGGESFDE